MLRLLNLSIYVWLCSRKKFFYLFTKPSTVVTSSVCRSMSTQWITLLLGCFQLISAQLFMLIFRIICKISPFWPWFMRRRRRRRHFFIIVFFFTNFSSHKHTENTFFHLLIDVHLNTCFMIILCVCVSLFHFRKISNVIPFVPSI